MILLIVSFAFLCNVCASNGDNIAATSSANDNYWKGFPQDGYQHGPIERPCSLQDVNCIRGYFAPNYQCSPAHGPARNPRKIKSIPMYLPHVNVSCVLNDVQIDGFNDFKIKEFYINKETEKLVLEVEFRRLRVYSPFAVITFHRKGKEPLELADQSFIEYRDLSLTLTAPYARKVQLSEAQVYTYLADAAPKYKLGPNLMESKEPLVKMVMRRMTDNIGLSVQEVFVTQGPIFMSVFLQITDKC